MLSDAMDGDAHLPDTLDDPWRAYHGDSAVDISASDTKHCSSISLSLIPLGVAVAMYPFKGDTGYGELSFERNNVLIITNNNGTITCVTSVLTVRV